MSASREYSLKQTGRIDARGNLAGSGREGIGETTRRRREKEWPFRGRDDRNSSTKEAEARRIPARFDAAGKQL